MLLTPPKKLHLSNANFPSHEELQSNFCGLHRATWEEAKELRPDLVPVLESSGVDLSLYDIDVKVHMLMKGQYPCIPNWHLDNVPRKDGTLQYDQIGDEEMLLWISEGPCTQFLKNEFEVHGITNHGDMAEAINRMDDSNFQYIEPERWYSMRQDTPHRGTPAVKNGWRIFIRLTPRSILPARPVLSVTRVHSQVYLPCDFHW